jgi:NitT/TauT family transport system permease protein
MAMPAMETPSATLAPVSRPTSTRISVLRRFPQLTISPAIFVALVAVWWLLTDVGGLPVYILPPPEQVLHALINGLSRAPWDKAGYWYHAGVTVWEAVLGFAIGSALGAVLGLALSHWPLLGKSWYPYIVGFQSLPKVALAPLMVVWFGFGLEGKVFITAIITFFPVLVNMMAGYQSVEPERIELARSCNASELHLLTKIVIPSCLPFLFAGLGVASVLSILGAVVGEFVGASSGLGMLLMQFNQSMEIASMFAVILMLAVIGFLMNHLVTLAERRYCFWAQRTNAATRP